MSRAKNHDQRKGQWLVNKIRSPDNKRYAEEFKKCYKLEREEYVKTGEFGNYWKAYVEQILFNIENDEYDKYMEDYDK